MRPVIKPDIALPKTKDLPLVGKDSFGLRRKIAEITIRNSPNMKSRRVCGRWPTNEEPIKLR
jgi:hypothetical protein